MRSPREPILDYARHQTPEAREVRKYALPEEACYFTDMDCVQLEPTTPLTDSRVLTRATCDAEGITIALQLYWQRLAFQRRAVRSLDIVQVHHR